MNEVEKARESVETEIGMHCNGVDFDLCLELLNAYARVVATHAYQSGHKRGGWLRQINGPEPPWLSDVLKEMGLDDE